MYWIHSNKEEPERLRKATLERLDREDLEKLRQQGFTEQAIAQLYHLRVGYAKSAMDQDPLDIRRLEFARWLVATGRLTDQIK